MKRYMKHDQINFFQSPHPSQFRALMHASPRKQWAQCHPDFLFQQPLKASSTTQPFNPPELPLSREQDLSMDCQIPLDPVDSNLESMLPQINRKISFSQQLQEQFVPFTPERKPIMLPMAQQSLQNQSTVQKKWNSTPLSQFKLCDRGLKKLASEAYSYVSTLKKTSYKDVATRLISKMSVQSRIQIEVFADLSQKKGQMNIKRRVYDALNVLLALGLLKRNGNRIQGKKGNDSLMISSNRDDHHVSEKDDENTHQRQYLRAQISSKQELLSRKRKILLELQKKASSLRDLQTRNRSTITPKNTIKLPFILVTSSAQSTEGHDQEASLNLWQENSTLNMSLPPQCELTGDLDALVAVKWQRTTKRSNKR